MTNEIEIYKTLLSDIKNREGCGKGVIRKLAVDLKNELSEVKGFLERNLQFMIQFFNEYKDIVSIRQPPVSQLKTNSNTKLPVSQLSNSSIFSFGELKTMPLLLGHKPANYCPTHKLLPRNVGQQYKRQQ